MRFSNQSGLVRLELVERRPLQHGGMGCLQDQFRRFASIEGLFPAGGTKAPLITLGETLEAKSRHRGGEIVALGLAEFQKVVGYTGANHVYTGVIGSGIAASVSEEPGEGVLRAALKVCAEHVLGHAAIGADEGSTVHTVATDRTPTSGRRLARALLAGLFLVMTACTGGVGSDSVVSGSADSESAGFESSITTGSDAAAGSGSTSTTSTTSPPALTRPDWLGQRPLATDNNGFGIPEPTPEELQDRILPTIDTLPPPATDTFSSNIGPLTGDPLARSTWKEGCPVPPEDLRYVTVTFWGFDGLSHTGELIVGAAWAEEIVGVFETAWDAGFPFEEMRIVTVADLDAEPTGDTNNTASFVCRAVTGGSRFSEHAYGLAIDINPFHNPYIRGDLILPELASSYLNRDDLRTGMLTSDHPVVLAFKDIGWSWGGDWNSLKDWHHFSHNGL